MTSPISPNSPSPTPPTFNSDGLDEDQRTLHNLTQTTTSQTSPESVDDDNAIRRLEEEIAFYQRQTEALEQRAYRLELALIILTNYIYQSREEIMQRQFGGEGVDPQNP